MTSLYLGAQQIVVLSELSYFSDLLDLICAFLNMIFRGDWSSASYPKRLNCYIRSVLQYLKKTMTNFGGCLLV